MHIMAAYYPERNMLASTLFLIMAIALILEEFRKSKFDVAIICSCWVLFFFAGIQFLHGSYDIYVTYEQCMQRNAQIEKEKAKGNLNVELPVISASTKYSAKYGLSDLDVTTP